MRLRINRMGISEGTSRNALLLIGVALVAVVAMMGLYLGGFFNSATPPANNTVPITASFDFDTGASVPNLSQSTPFNYTSGGVTARFSSPLYPNAFSVQSLTTTSFVLSEFSGKFLYDNEIQRTVLIIEFNRTLTYINMTFATVEYHGGANDEPSTLSLNAYMNSTSPQIVGTMTSKGTWPSGSYFPQGSIAFNSSGQPFNLVRIELPLVGSAVATDFMIDNIVVVAR